MKLHSTHCITEHIDLFCLFGVRFYVSVNSYGQVETVSSPNNTLFLGKLDLSVNQYFVQILVTDNNPS